MPTLPNVQTVPTLHVSATAAQPAAAAPWHAASQTSPFVTYNVPTPLRPSLPRERCSRRALPRHRCAGRRAYRGARRYSRPSPASTLQRPDPAAAIVLCIARGNASREPRAALGSDGAGWRGRGAMARPTRGISGLDEINNLGVAYGCAHLVCTCPIQCGNELHAAKATCILMGSARTAPATRLGMWTAGPCAKQRRRPSSLQRTRMGGMRDRRGKGSKPSRAEAVCIGDTPARRSDEREAPRDDETKDAIHDAHRPRS